MSEVLASAVKPEPGRPSLEGGEGEGEAGSVNSSKAGTVEDKRRVFDPKAPKKYKPWDKEEMLLLRRGVQRHGVGNWEAIRQDPEFKLLQLRTGVQIKDKWRNLVKFRHLTEEEKQAIALRTSKLNRRTAARSTSFTFGPDGGVVEGKPARSGKRLSGGVSSGGQYQSFSAYAQAREARMRTEAELRDAQTAYEQASSAMEEHMAVTQQTPWSEGAPGVEELFATANAAMRQLTLCKQRAQAARELESNLMKSLHLEPNQFGGQGTQSLPSSPMGGMAGMSPFADQHAQTRRPNAEILYGRSQSYDPSCFSRLLQEEDVSCTSMQGRRTLSSFSDDGVSGGIGGSESYISGPPSLMIRTSATTRSPRKVSSGSVPSSPLGRMQRHAPGRNSPLARSMSLFGTHDNVTPSSSGAQLPNQFDIQLGQHLMRRGMCNQVDHMNRAVENQEGVRDSYPDNPFGFEGHMPTSTGDSNTYYYAADGLSTGHAPTRRASGDSCLNTMFSSNLASMSTAPGSAGMHHAAAYSCGNHMDTGMYPDMFSGGAEPSHGMQGGVKNELLDISSAATLDLQLPEFTENASSSGVPFGNSACSDVLIDCMEEMLDSDAFMGSIPNMDDCH